MNGEYTNLNDQPIVLPNAIFMKLESDGLPYTDRRVREMCGDIGKTIKIPMIKELTGKPTLKDELNIVCYLKDLQKECNVNSIFGDSEPLEPKELTPEEIREQEEFNASMKKLRKFMEENNITVDDLKDEFDLRSDEDY